MSTIQLVCPVCTKSFEKERKEYNRRVRLGKTLFFCSEICGGASHSTAYNAFKFILRTAKKNSKNRPKEYQLTQEHLETLWASQKGKCAYTGVDLVLPHPCESAGPRTASLDRIDSSKGYVEGNVEFVCVFVNLGKNGFSKQQVLDLLKDFKL